MNGSCSRQFVGLRMELDDKTLQLEAMLDVLSIEGEMRVAMDAARSSH